jgi:hypothetical protein
MIQTDHGSGAAALLINSVTLARTDNVGYSINPDQKGASDLIQSIH